MANIGGRLLPFKAGDPRYDDDLYKAQRRRPWMMFSLGIRIDDDLMTLFKEKVPAEMLKEGILLDEQPLQCSQFRQSRQPLVDGITDGLKRCEETYPQGPLSKPIVIVVSDAFGYMKHILHGQIHMVKFSVRQFEDTVRGNLGFLKHRCVSLSTYLRKHEQLREGIAYAVPIEKSARQPRNEPGTPSYQHIFQLFQYIPKDFRRARCIGMATENTVVLHPASKTILRRLEDPFQYLYQNLDLLVLMNYAVATRNPKCVTARNDWIRWIMNSTFIRMVPRMHGLMGNNVQWHYHSVTFILELFRFFEIVLSIDPALLNDHRRFVESVVEVYRAHYRQTGWITLTSQHEEDKMEEIIKSIEATLSI